MNDDCFQTDLAIEYSEKFKKDNVEIDGVVIRKRYDNKKEILVTTVSIENEQAAKVMKRPVGTYITIESILFDSMDEKDSGRLSDVLTRELNKLTDNKKNMSILIAGLGNREVTADSLGPLSADNIAVDVFENEKEDKVALYAVVPGVFSFSGIESAEIIKGITNEVKPDYIFAIDALAARQTERLNRTIQISDTGIIPGSGVGNARYSIDQKTMGTKVISIGVPTVINAATIIYDSLEKMLSSLNESEKEYMSNEVLTKKLREMYVTSGDIDENIKRISKIIAKGINGLTK